VIAGQIDDPEAAIWLCELIDRELVRLCTRSGVGMTP
jgi:hypothetical protein